MVVGACVRVRVYVCAYRNLATNRSQRICACVCMRMFVKLINQAMTRRFTASPYFGEKRIQSRCIAKGGGWRAQQCIETMVTGAVIAAAGCDVDVDVATERSSWG